MKNMFLTAILVMIFSFPAAYSQNRSILFRERPWAEIQEAAKKENKLIFLDAYASWCGPCKWMAANIFTNDTVADYYNEKFICAKIDMEKGEGITLAKKYEVRAYPTLLFISPDGEMVHKKVGAYRNVSEYINLGMNAQEPDKCFSSTLKKYQAGNLDPDFIFIHLSNLKDAYLPVTEPLKKYISTQKSEDLISQANWNIIYNFSDDINSSEFIYLVSHHKEFEKRYTKDAVQRKIDNVYSYELNKFFRMKPFPQASWDNLIGIIKQSGYSRADEVVLDARLSLYSYRKDTTGFLSLAFSEVDLIYRDDYTKLNNVAWQVYNYTGYTGNKKYLEKAAEWSKRSVELMDEPFNNNTYAAILFKLGEKKEAIRIQTKAIELARKNNLPTKAYEDALLKMKTGK